MAFVKTTSPATIVFYGENNTDLSLMPTTVKPGEGKYGNYGLAPKGSIAKILTDSELQYYMLRSTGWVSINEAQIKGILI